jgi:2-haloacid dehalogenase
MTDLAAGNYRTVTFDCYGTLIDWENGILGYLQPLLESYDVHVLDDWVLEFFAENEPALQAEGGSYRSVLERLLARLGTRCAFTPSEDTLKGFADSIEYWQPFADTNAALRALAERFDLAVVSNVDNELFSLSARQLGVEFAHVITAEDVGAYKPDRAMFDEALRRCQGPVLHVAQSLFHDIAPAKALGLDTVWINRPSAAGSGAARPAEVEPTWTFGNLDEFVRALDLA